MIHVLFCSPPKSTHFSWYKSWSGHFGVQWHGSSFIYFIALFLFIIFVLFSPSCSCLIWHSSRLSSILHSLLRWRERGGGGVLIQFLFCFVPFHFMPCFLLLSFSSFFFIYLLLYSREKHLWDNNHWPCYAGCQKHHSDHGRSFLRNKNSTRVSIGILTWKGPMIRLPLLQSQLLWLHLQFIWLWV